MAESIYYNIGYIGTWILILALIMYLRYVFWIKPNKGEKVKKK